MDTSILKSLKNHYEDRGVIAKRCVDAADTLMHILLTLGCRVNLAKNEQSGMPFLRIEVPDKGFVGLMFQWLPSPDAPFGDLGERDRRQAVVGYPVFFVAGIYPSQSLMLAERGFLDLMMGDQVDGTLSQRFTFKLPNDWRRFPNREQDLGVLDLSSINASRPADQFAQAESPKRVTVREYDLDGTKVLIQIQRDREQFVVKAFYEDGRSVNGFDARTDSIGNTVTLDEASKCSAVSHMASFLFEQISKGYWESFQAQVDR